jgi:hypothetical protein
MDCHPWLERVIDRLAGQGLPAVVRARLQDELRDHLDDLIAGGMTMATEIEIERQMGSPEELAAAAAAAYRDTAWVRRHSLLVFGLAPLPSALLGVVVYFLSAAAVGYAVAAIRYGGGGIAALPRHILIPVATGFTYSVRFLPFLTLAAAFGFLAIRYRVRGGWLAAAIVQVALLAGAITAHLYPSDLAGQSQLGVGLELPFAGWLQTAQLLVPLLVGILFLRSSSRRASMGV